MSRFAAPAVLTAALVAGGALAFDPGGWFVFGPIKWVVVTVLAVAAAALAFGTGTTLHRPSTAAWGAFLVWAAVTSLTALDGASAWLGTPDRRFGLVALFTSACAYVGGQAVDTPGGRTAVGRGVVVALLGMTAYGLLELAGLDPVRLTTTTERLGSTYGSAAYLGAALALFLPVAVGVAAGEEQRAWKWAGFISVIGGALLLAGAGTRAALVGLLAAAVISAPRWVRSIRPTVVVGVAVVIVATVAISPLGSRALAPSVDGRLDEWRIGLAALATEPWDGVGPEGYRIVFPRHVDAPYVQAYGRDTVTDRAHSGPIDIGIALGLPGMAAWLAAFAFLVIKAQHAVRHLDPVLAGVGAGVVGLLGQELLLFPTVEVGVAGWALAGVLVAADARRNTPLRSPMVATGLGLVAAAALIVGVLDVAADHRAAAARQTGDVTAADAAAHLRPDSFRYPLLAAQIALDGADAPGALDRVGAARRLSPLDPALRLAEARVVTVLAAERAVDLDQALNTVDRAVAADPHHPTLRMLHGELLAGADRPGEAERAWLTAAHLAPDDPEPHLRLVTLYAALGEHDLAAEAAERAQALR